MCIKATRQPRNQEHERQQQQRGDRTKVPKIVLETTKDKTKLRFLKGAIRSVDVKAADIAAQVIEANKEAEAATDTPVEAEVVVDTPAENTEENNK